MNDFKLDDTLDFKFTTRAFATGVPTTLGGTPVVQIYEDNSLTQITAGVTLTTDFDSVVGLNNLRVVATGGNGFETGKSYACVISTGSVGGVSVVGEVVQQFSIERSPAFARLGAPAGASIAADLADVPTVAELNARTLVSASYFDPATDTIATVTNLTNLPSIPANWLTAAGIATGALDGKGNWNIGKTGFALSATGLDLIVSTAAGFVEIAKAVWDRILTGATHNINNSAGKRLREASGEFGSYSGSAVYLDTVNGTAGTTINENGTDRFPVLTLADVNTLLAATGLNRVVVVGGSTVTLVAAQNDQEFLGNNWTLALAGQDIGGTYFKGAFVSGTGLGSSKAIFDDCTIDIVFLNQADFKNSRLTDAVTLTEGAVYNFSLCEGAPDAGIVSLTYAPTVGAASVHLNGYSGDIVVKSMSGSDNFECAMVGALVFDASNVGGTADFHGIIDSLNSSSGIVMNEAGNVPYLIRSESGLSNMDYHFTTPTTATDPGTGNLKFNNVAKSLVTAVYVHEDSEAGTNERLHFDKVVAGDVLRIMEEHDAQRYVNYTVTAAPTDNTGWWTVPVSHENDNGTLFGANDVLLLSIKHSQNLTAQQARDAMKLAPTAGAPASGSVDEHLDNIEVDTQGIQSRLPAALVGGKIDASVSAIDAATANKVADHTLRRTSANARGSSDGDAVSFRSSLGSVSKLTNKLAPVAGSLLIYEEDDATVFGTQTMVTDAAAAPIVSLDTV